MRCMIVFIYCAAEDNSGGSSFSLIDGDGDRGASPMPYVLNIITEIKFNSCGW